MLKKILFEAINEENNGVLHKLSALRRVNTDHGSSDNEEESAKHLMHKLMDKHGVEIGDVLRHDQDHNPAPKDDKWSAWRQLAQENSLKLHTFGSRGQTTLPSGHKVNINANDNSWEMENTRLSGQGHHSLRRHIESFRPAYTFQKKKA